MKQHQAIRIGCAAAVAAALAACGGSDGGGGIGNSAIGASAAPAPQFAAGTQSATRADIASFGLTEDATYYTIDTGAGLVFKVRRFDNGSNTQSAGDIASMIYNGVQYQDATRGSQITSGFDYLYNGVSAVTVAATQVDADHIKVTVKAGDLTHYYMVKRGEANIYMGTYFTSEPNIHGLVRYIVRIPINALPNGPEPSDLRGTNGAIESGDVFGRPDGQTRSKHYSNLRLKDWQHIGATSATAGVYIVRDNNEGGSGGPFYRSLLNQATATNQELTYIVNYGEAQTEPFRLSVLNSYTMVFNNGAAPGPVDTSWFSGMGLLGYVAPAARGGVAGVGLSGRDASQAYTVGFSNAKAQYWTNASAATGSFNSGGMLPGDYTMSIYKNELVVGKRTVTVNAGSTLALNTITIADDPGAVAPVWRIGAWDGSPQELLNGDKVTTMHPSDIRMASWVTPDYVVGTSTAKTGFPAYQWKAVNGAITIRFNLRASQIANYTLRAGITTAHAGGRPKAQVNGWVSANPAASTQPNTRTLTVGTYRGNNTMYTFNIPASELVVGQNVVTLTAISGQTSTGFLSPGYSYDAVDLIPTPAAQ